MSAVTKEAFRIFGKQISTRRERIMGVRRDAVTEDIEADGRGEETEGTR